MGKEGFPYQSKSDKMDMEDYRHPQFKYAYYRPKEGLQMPKGNVNIVHDEQIWRDHIRTETNTLKTWESKWGFTKEYGWRKPDPLYVALSAGSKPKTSIHQRLKWPVDGCI